MSTPLGRNADALQRALITRLAGDLPEQRATTIVVCPSLSFPVEELAKITGVEHYEERLLCLALLLRRPDLHLVYPTSAPIDEAVVDYYLQWLDEPGSARRRLHLLPLGDIAPTPLTDKLVRRRDVLSSIRELVDDDGVSFILPFNVTGAEARLSEALGVPLYGPHPDAVWLGSKSGARAVAEEAGVRVFEGASDLHSLEEIREAVRGIVRRRPDVDAVVAKLNHGFSGQGNVIIEVATLGDRLESSPAVFCAPGESWESYGPKVAADGAIVEELARVAGTVSPSVQLRVLPNGRVEELSTHDQILGGPDGQVYLGCRFPAGPTYRRDIREAARRVAQVLAGRGVIGSFGIDFVVVPGRGVFLSEINLRLGGTTHPFLMARYVTGGVYDPDAGELMVDGEPRVYTSSDNVKSETFIGLRPADVIAAVADAGQAFDTTTNTGVTLHLLGALPRYGKFGVVCIARSPGDADDMYATVLRAVERLARA